MRADGRGIDELRKLRLEVGVLKNAKGSAYVEWGMNKILVGVYGPEEAPPAVERAERCILKVEYRMATFCSLEEHGKYTPNRRAVEISKVLREALSNLIILENYPGGMIEVQILVLQAEGGTRVASFLGAVAALIDAGIAIRDIGYGISAGKINNTIVLDLSKEEDNLGQGDIPICVTRRGDIVLLQSDGKIQPEELERAIDMIISKRDVFENIIREAFMRRYSKELDSDLVKVI
ncbi:MAG: exosome complex exonuclease Rrp41 [Candidatus Micrarchaeota archaeon]|nr:exosome complex exonuclease Rrp41 [Candidatus Micrarchaeota archaeon]MCX8154599.1 exosome complex exonuclease Rrp41 [Candidatus Micrarchaeota archaeon]